MENYRDKLLNLRVLCKEEHTYEPNPFFEGGLNPYSLRLKVSLPVYNILEMRDIPLEHIGAKDIVINEMYGKVLDSYIKTSVSKYIRDCFYKKELEKFG